MKNIFFKNLLSFIDTSTCSYTCVEFIKSLLVENNYQELKEEEEWNLENNKKYFIVRNESSIIAFKIPSHKESFSIITTHCDTPSLLLKPNGWYKKDNYLQYNVSPYGGILNCGWLDHPLSIAGRIFIKKNQEIISKIIDIHKTCMIVPSVAIHLATKSNTNLSLNSQTDLQSIISIQENEPSIKDLETLLNIAKNETLIDYDLYAYHNEKPTYIGLRNELLLSPRIDNITSVYSALEAFLTTKKENSIPVFVSFNHEEIGSMTQEGAESNFLKSILTRICKSLNIEEFTTFSKSKLMNADNTHAIHPNHTEYNDNTGNIYPGKGFAIIRERNYTTNYYLSSLLKDIWNTSHIKYQEATMKNDIAGGSTIAGIILKQVSIPTIEVGIGELSMHSSLELCSKEDIYNLYQAMIKFYEI